MWYEDRVLINRTGYKFRGSGVESEDRVRTENQKNITNTVVLVGQTMA